MEIKDLPKRKEVKYVESPIEDILLGALQQYKLKPELQYEIGPYRADLAFPDIKLVIECDGLDYHSTPEQVDRDVKRDIYMEGLGWKVKRYLGSEIYRDKYEICKEILKSYYPRTIYQGMSAAAKEAIEYQNFAENKHKVLILAEELKIRERINEIETILKVAPK